MHQIKTLTLHTNIKFTLCFSILLGIAGHGFAQEPTKVELLHANSLEVDESIAPNARRLIGDVSFKHDDAIMHCDSAYLYSLTNSLDAFGNVHIIQADTVDVYGDKLNYNGNTKIAILTDNVKLDDKTMVLTTDKLTYNMETKKGFYTTGGKIVDKENVLTSIIGYYFEDKDQFFFKDSVVLNNPKYIIYSDTLMFNTTTEIAYFYGPTNIYSDENLIYCENGWYNTVNDKSQFNKNAYLQSDEQTIRGDSLYYDRATGFGKALENVEVIDTVQHIIINGDYAEYHDKEENTIVTGNTLLRQKFDSDTMYLHADTLRTELDTTLSDKRTLYAYHKVKIFRDDMQGLCDSLVYSYADSTIRMFQNPVLWSDSSQLTADTINILIHNNKVKELHMRNTSFIISREDSAFYNQIKGRNMIGHFKNDKLHKVNVYGNGQTIYFVSDEGSKEVDNVNQAESSDLVIYIDSNKVSKIVFLSQPDATLYPIQEVNINDMRLQNFSWHGHRRPMKIEDIFIWQEAIKD